MLSYQSKVRVAFLPWVIVSRRDAVLVVRRTFVVGIAMIFGLSVDKGRISLIEWDDLDLFGHVATERTD